MSDFRFHVSGLRKPLRPCSPESFEIKVEVGAGIWLYLAQGWPAASFSAAVEAGPTNIYRRLPARKASGDY
jgi:hypothetical protein